MYRPERYRADPLRCDCIDIESQQLVETREGDVVCQVCARVVESHVIDMRPEWYNAENSRAGGVGRDDFLLGSSSGAAVVPPNKSRFAEPDPHKHIRLGLKEIERLVGLFRLDTECNICKSAKEMYRDYCVARTEENRTIRESERTAAAAVALYYGFKVEKVPRTVKEILATCGIVAGSLDKLIKNYRKLLATKPYFSSLLQSTVAKDVVVRVFNNIDFSSAEEKNKIMKRSQELFELVSSKGILDGKSPDTVCSAVVYKAAQEAGAAVTKKMVYKACCVSNVTLNKALAELNEHI